MVSKNSDRTDIYTDKQYGMSTYKSLTYWVACALENRAGESPGPAYKILQDYFLAADNIVLTDADMNSICGVSTSENTGQLRTLIGNLEAKLLADNKVPSIPISAATMSAT